MLGYGYTILISKIENLQEGEDVSQLALVIQLDDYKNIMDTYLVYSFLKKNPNMHCDFSDDLTRLLDKISDVSLYNTEDLVIEVGGIGVFDEGVYHFGNEIIDVLPNSFTRSLHIEKKALEPIIIWSEKSGEEMISTAIVFKYFLRTFGTSDEKRMLQFLVDPLLPEVFIKPITIAKWKHLFKGGNNGSSVAGSRFVAKSGKELATYLDNLVDIPKGKSYSGSLYRSLTKDSEIKFGAVADKMTDHTVYSSWGRYDLDKAENAMYLSKTIDGNKTEVLHYLNDWSAWSTYEFKNMDIENLLDLTDDIVRQKLGTTFDDLVRTIGLKNETYEITNTITSWARKKGYNGIIAPGARGAKDYENIIIFDQVYIDKILKGKKITKMKK